MLKLKVFSESTRSVRMSRKLEREIAAFIRAPRRTVRQMSQAAYSSPLGLHCRSIVVTYYDARR